MTRIRAGRSLATGIAGGIIGSVAMGAFAMISAATYQKAGGFTPRYHIAASVIEPATMERSMQEVMGGNLWHLDAGPAIVGAGIHMAVGAFWRLVFVLVPGIVGLSRSMAPFAGAAHGLVVMVAMAFVGLPAVASLFGGGPPIRDMAQMVGWSTFTAEHAIFGFMLGVVWALAVPPSPVPARGERRIPARAA